MCMLPRLRGLLELLLVLLWLIFVELGLGGLAVVQVALRVGENGLLAVLAVVPVLLAGVTGVLRRLRAVRIVLPLHCVSVWRCHAIALLRLGLGGVFGGFVLLVVPLLRRIRVRELLLLGYLMYVLGVRRFAVVELLRGRGRGRSGIVGVLTSAVHARVHIRGLSRVLAVVVHGGRSVLGVLGPVVEGIMRIRDGVVRGATELLLGVLGHALVLRNLVLAVRLGWVTLGLGGGVLECAWVAAVGRREGLTLHILIPLVILFVTTLLVRVVNSLSVALA